MFLTRCSLCGHDNPEHSRFCNGCGASLPQVEPPPLASVPPQLPAAAESKPDLAAPHPAARPVRPHPGRLNPVHRWLIACSPVATVLAGLAYFTYNQLTVTDVAGLLPATLPTETSARVEPGGIVPANAVMPRTPPAPEPVAAPPLAAVIDEPRPPREHGATTRKTTPAGAKSDRPAEPTPIDLGPCTASVAALGLCTPPTLAAIKE